MWGFSLRLSMFSDIPWKWIFLGIDSCTFQQCFVSIFCKWVITDRLIVILEWLYCNKYEFLFSSKFSIIPWKWIFLGIIYVYNYIVTNMIFLFIKGFKKYFFLGIICAYNYIVTNMTFLFIRGSNKSMKINFFAFTSATFLLFSVFYEWRISVHTIIV